jgi:hypothetical protein
MRIAIVDDKMEEIEKGSKAVRDAGHEPVLGHVVVPLRRVIRELNEQGVEGYITDLMFDSLAGDDDTGDGIIRPAGLLVVIHALLKELPVVICSDMMSTGGHHSQEYSWIYDGYLGCPVGVKKPILIEDKNWNHAVTALITGERP